MNNSVLLFLTVTYILQGLVIGYEIGKYIHPKSLFHFTLTFAICSALGNALEKTISPVYLIIFFLLILLLIYLSTSISKVLSFFFLVIYFLFLFCFSGIIEYALIKIMNISTEELYNYRSIIICNCILLPILVVIPHAIRLVFDYLFTYKNVRKLRICIPSLICEIVFFIALHRLFQLNLVTMTTSNMYLFYSLFPLGIALINFFLLRDIHTIDSSHEKKCQKLALELYLQEQTTAFQQFEEACSALSRFRHDCSNHLQSISYCVKNGLIEDALDQVHSLLSHMDADSASSYDEYLTAYQFPYLQSSDTSSDLSDTTDEKPKSMLHFLTPYILSEAFIFADIYITSNFSILSAHQKWMFVFILVFLLGILNLTLGLTIKKLCQMHKDEVAIIQLDTVARSQQETYRKYHENLLILKDLHMKIHDKLLAVAEKLEDGRINDALTQLDADYIATSRINNSVFTGNNTVDSILNLKKKIMEKNQIAFSWTGTLPADLPLDPCILCSILFNILDNAIEGCRQVAADTEKNICFKTGIFNQKCIISCTNSCISGSIYNTSSPSVGQEHGWGMNIIKKNVQDNDGDVVFTCSDHIFSVIVYLPVLMKGTDHE